MLRRKKVRTSLTTTALDNSKPTNSEPDFTHPKFKTVVLSGVFSNADWVGTDGNDKEYTFPGGVGFVFNWSADGIGFGEFCVKRLTDGTLEIESEGMGKEFLKKALCSMIDTAKELREQTN